MQCESIVRRYVPEGIQEPGGMVTDTSWHTGRHTNPLFGIRSYTSRYCLRDATIYANLE